MKNILITGASGFLGRHLTKRLQDLKYSIYISNTEIANLLNIENIKIYDNIKFEYIFHLATKAKAGGWCKYHKGEQWIDNQLINTNILKYWHEYQPQAKMVSFGTSCSYGPSEDPLPESDYLLYQPDEDLYTYAMTKRMLLVGCKSLAEQYGLKYIHYIPSTLYGPLFDIHDTHFIFDLIKKIVNGKYNNEQVELWGTGDQRRELIYIDDAIDIIINTMHLENELINIGSQKDYSIKEYANMICQYLSYPEKEVQYNKNKFVGVNRKIVSTCKLNSLLEKQFNYIDVRIGLEKTIDYYLKAMKL